MCGYIVVVEDDSDLVTMLCDLLREELDSMSLVAAHDGQEALALLQGTFPALVVIDLMLPGQSGIEIAAQLQEHGYSSVPLIAITGSSYLADLAHESGLFRGVLEKPFDLDELLLAVCDLIAPTDGRATAGDSPLPPWGETAGVCAQVIGVAPDDHGTSL